MDMDANEESLQKELPDGKITFNEDRTSFTIEYNEPTAVSRIVLLVSHDAIFRVRHYNSDGQLRGPAWVSFYTYNFQA